jgi:hypothetical protein
MRTDLWRRGKKKKKQLFKTKTQPTNSSNDHGKDEWHNMKVNAWMHSRYAKIADLVE